MAGLCVEHLVEFPNVFITEREAAFNLLSIYDSNGNVEVKTPKKKERVKIALQVLERYGGLNVIIKSL